MVYRYSWVAGVTAIVFALWRLGNLLEPSTAGIRWQLVVLAALLTGAVVTATAARYRIKVGWIVLLNIVLFLVAAGRYGAPRAGIGTEMLAAIWAEMERATDVIRHGVEPVEPFPGLVLVLAAVFWTLGTLLAFGLLRGRPFVALLPPLVVGLQLLTIERKPTSNLEIALFVLLVAGTALAVGVDERDRGAGRMTSPEGTPSRLYRAPLSMGALGFAIVTVVAAIGVSTALATRIPEDGVMTWRAASATTGLYGSISYNPYVQIHRGLVSQTGTALFTSHLDGDVAPSDVYYRLITLEDYHDGRWSLGGVDLSEPNAGGVFAFEDDRYAYAGPTASVDAAITIHDLRQDWLPIPYAVRGFEGEDADSFRLRTKDASVRYRTYDGMEYAISADVPLMDSGAIATDASGRLSPLFAVAAERSGSDLAPTPQLLQRTLPAEGDYLELPDDIDPRIEQLARDRTANLTTDFEKGFALEYWFRESGGFTYTLQGGAEQGHSPDALAAFLVEPGPTYRRGYCEQFATAMGVMARSLGIPTRVVLGFLPGETTDSGGVLVRDLSAHSWVELWIPSQGWMRFDPTPRADGLNPNSTYRNLEAQLGFDVAAYLGQVPEQPVDGLPLDPLDLTGQPEPGLPGFPLPIDAPQGVGRISWIATAIVGLAALVAIGLGVIPAVKWARRRARMRRLAHGDITAAWEEIVARLADLDREVDPAATPTEVAEAVDPALAPLAAVYGKSVYGPGTTLTAAEVETAERSMEVTADRLSEGMSSRDRVRVTFRMASLIGSKRLSRWLPWLRP